MTNEQLVSKVWNYAHVLRDQGISFLNGVKEGSLLFTFRRKQVQRFFPIKLKSFPIRYLR